MIQPALPITGQPTLPDVFADAIRRHLSMHVVVPVSVVEDHGAWWIEVAVDGRRYAVCNRRDLDAAAHDIARMAT
jgi:hypothetical protein